MSVNGETNLSERTCFVVCGGSLTRNLEHLNPLACTHTPDILPSERRFPDDGKPAINHFPLGGDALYSLSYLMFLVVYTAAL